MSSLHELTVIQLNIIYICDCQTNDLPIIIVDQVNRYDSENLILSVSKNSLITCTQHTGKYVY